MPTGNRIEAEIRAGDISVQLVSHEWPCPVDAIFTEAESEHVVALQRQPPQARSDGRLYPGGDGRFGEIGRVLAIPAGAQLHIRASGGAVRAVRCAFTVDAFRRVGGGAELADLLTPRAALDIRARRIAETLRRLGEEAANPGLASALLVEGLGATLMVDLSRHLAGSPRPMRGGLTQRQLRRVTERVEDEAAIPTLSELARIAGVSERHLTRAFRAATGRTVHEYMEESRFRRATELLGHSDLLLKDIAFRLGFGHPCSFSTAFRKFAGETPRAYRERMFARQ
jgi:AraC family transcriptional regulator